ncbi:MAG: redoxin domain-containing protein [Ignavibacteria bacterium]
MNYLKFIKITLLVLCVTVVALLIVKNFYRQDCDSLKIKNRKEKNEKPVIKNVNASDLAPEIMNSGQWINTEKEITFADLKGKVVVIEFWTFGCYNCVNTLPYLKKWYDKYKSDDFEMIGIHCPEFDNERDFENVKENTQRLGIKYPVLTDNEFSVWKEYDVHAWPTIFIIDRKGEIRYKKVGEGKYDEMEQKINELLNENFTNEIKN